MNIHTRSTPMDKLIQNGDANRFEAVGDRPEDEQPLTARNKPLSIAGVMSCITHVTTPTGKKPVLKAMVTTACERDCHYCPFRAGRTNIRHVTFNPDELARAFDRLEGAGLVDGIFISSGIIKGGMLTQDKILDSVEIIRNTYRYQGYVHVKIMPGSEYDQILRAMQLADRVSINLEGPTDERLTALAPKKDLSGDLLQRMQWAGDIKRRAHENAAQGMTGAIRASIVTQFVVGAVGDTDLELLSMTDKLHQQMNLARAYFSRFNPVSNTPFENLDPTPPIRERRLYQASYLLRDYQWDVEELPFEGPGNLRLDVDPKQAWADVHLAESPIDVMTADRAALMRIPGIGPKSATRIIRARRRGSLRDLADLRGIGIRGTTRIAPYVLLDGHRPDQQLRLF